jgi:hypothetical protein
MRLPPSIGTGTMSGVPDNVRAGVQGLLGHLDRLNRQQALNLVLPALSRDEVAADLEAVGITGTDPILDWYTSWGGQTPGGVLGVMDVLPGFYALSLADSLAHRGEHPEWSGGWLPILADGGGDYYVADSSTTGAPVLRLRYDDPQPERLSNSLTSFLVAANRAFDQQVIYVSDGFLDQDEEAWRGLLGVE